MKYRKFETRQEVFDTIRLCHFKQLLATHIRHADEEHDGVKFAVLETSFKFADAEHPIIELHSVYGKDAQGLDFERNAYFLCVGVSE